MEVQDRFFEEPLGSYFLFGPRGTGKSTWLRQRYPNAATLDLLKPDLYRRYVARPERLAELVAGQSSETVIVVDEVQRIPELLSVVHDLIEREKGRKFVLTGSSARKIKRQGVDLLAGRALSKALHPFMAAELADSFCLADALEIGLVPLVVDAQDPKETLRSYAALYLHEEVKMEGLVRNLGAFSRFLEAASFSHGAVLSVAAVARECQVERNTVKGYLGILEDLLLSFTIPVFSRRAKRKTISHPKFYFFDSGVFRSLRPRGPLDRATEIEGAALEGLVAQHLRAWISYRRTDDRLYFWRTRSGVEVDFVVYGEDGLWAVEVKNGSVVHRKDLRALKSFGQDYPESRRIFLYRGMERLLIDDILCLPVEDFLRFLEPSRSLASL